MTNLSSEAQEVLNRAFAVAFYAKEQTHGEDCKLARSTAAAAIRAAADQVVPSKYQSLTGCRDWDQGAEAKHDSIRESLLDIANELEKTYD